MTHGALVDLPPDLMRRTGHAADGAVPQATRSERRWAALVFGMMLVTLVASLVL